MSYILTLTAFIFVTAATLGLLPENSLKKTVKLVCGGILACLIISPLAKWSNIDLSRFADITEYNAYTETIDRLKQTQLEQTENALQESLREKYGENIRLHIENGIFYVTSDIATKSDISRFLGVDENIIQMTE